MRPLPIIISALVIAGIIPSGVMLVLAGDLRIAKSDQRPFIVAAAVESDHHAQATLRERGFRYQITVTGAQVQAVMRGSLPHDARLVVQRPDDASRDQIIAWKDPTMPMIFTPGRPGRWRVRLEGTVDGVVARLAESALEIGP